MNCEAIGHQGRYPYTDSLPCGEPTDKECAYCGLPVCIRCTLPCYECGLDLHDGCREDHAKESGHEVDMVRLRLSGIDVFVDRVMAIVERAS